MLTMMMMLSSDPSFPCPATQGGIDDGNDEDGGGDDDGDDDFNDDDNDDDGEGDDDDDDEFTNGNASCALLKLFIWPRQASLITDDCNDIKFEL